MSAILGIVRLNDQPVYSEQLYPMVDAMSQWGPDGKHTTIDRCAGFGHLMLHNSPESLYEIQPAESSCGNLLISSQARLDNRTDLLKSFDIPVSLHKKTSDGALILRAYQKWGKGCVHHLLGDWCFSIWDKREQTLFIGRDHHGVSGLFYYHSATIFVFCSGLNGLLAVPDIPRKLNEERIAGILTSWSGCGNATVYDDIFRLPPAHTMTVSSKGVQLDRYWCLENTPLLRLKTDADYVEAFLEIYHEAVRCRLRSASPVGITLSGGLDSGSIAALAAPQLARKGHKLQAFSSVPLYDPSGVLPLNRFEESPYIKSTASYVGNIETQFIKAQNITLLESLNLGLLVHGEPVHAAANQHWLLSLWDAAQEQNVKTMLTGGMGNYTVSWHGGGSLAYLLRQLKGLTLYREFRAMRRQNSGKTLIETIRAEVLSPLLPLPVKRWRRHIRGGPEPWVNYSAIHPDLARKLDLTSKMYRQGHDPQFSISGAPRSLRLKGLKSTHGIVGSRLQQSGSYFGIELRDPTMDKRILEFCLSIPDDQYVRDGQNRFLIRRAFKGRLPDDVLLNRYRGFQSSDVGFRVIHERESISEALSLIQKKSELANKYLEFKRMRNVLEDLSKRVDRKTVIPTMAILLRGLMVGLFLYELETGRIPPC